MQDPIETSRGADSNAPQMTVVELINKFRELIKQDADYQDALGNLIKAAVKLNQQVTPLAKKEFAKACKGFIRYTFQQNREDAKHQRHMRICLAFLIVAAIILLTSAALLLAIGKFHAFDVTKQLFEKLIMPVLLTALSVSAAALAASGGGFRYHRDSRSEFFKTGLEISRQQPAELAKAQELAKDEKSINKS